MSLNGGPDTAYFDSVPHWEIEMALNSQYSLRIGHLGGIAPTLRDKILAATGIDTDSYTGPPGDLCSDADINLDAGDALAFPQVFARELPQQPGYYRGGGSLISPWAQMEFTIADHLEDGEVCVYDLIAPKQKAAIQSAMTADMGNPDSQRYLAYAGSRWIWSAEGLLCPVYSLQPVDFSNIHTRVGGWTERPAAGTTVSEQFAIVKIENTASIYDANRYDSPTVDHLALRAVGPGLPGFSWMIPDGAVATPFIAVDEVIEERSDTLLIKWRDIGWSAPAYQRATFLLDSHGLTIKWGEFSATAGGARPPSPGSDDACNDSDVVCYDHEARL